MLILLTMVKFSLTRVVGPLRFIAQGSADEPARRLLSIVGFDRKEWIPVLELVAQQRPVCGLSGHRQADCRMTCSGPIPDGPVLGSAGREVVILLRLIGQNLPVPLRPQCGHLLFWNNDRLGSKAALSPWDLRSRRALRAVPPLALILVTRLDNGHDCKSDKIL